MESYVERFAREQKEKAQKESRKPQKGRKVKEVQKDGTYTRSEGHEAPAEKDGQSPAD